MPKISVIVPIYNVEQYLNRCIDSVLNQTYADLEVILVDDGSPDNCPAICDDYAGLDARVKVIHKKNGGLSSARNAGLEIAQGDYIAFVDSDDWIDLGMYEALINLAEEYNADIVQSEYRFYRPWKKENQILDCDNTGTIDCYTNIEALETLYFGPQRFGGITILVVTKLYKAELLQNIRFCEGYIHEDVEFTPRVLYAAKRIIKYNKSFYTYNIHLGASSTSGMKLSVHKLDSTVYMRKRVANFFEGNYVERVSEYTKSMYYDSLINAYYECRLRQHKNHEFKSKGQEFLDEINGQKKNILSCAGWKAKLFFFSRMLYCAAVWNLRTAKKVKYRLRVILTGKN